ncbi:MAG: polysaccharide deacetylase family protein [Clostridia bacterium]|nr:polysaccharide deacetylase family protein [Clostridia bacterium]
MKKAITVLLLSFMLFCLLSPSPALGEEDCRDLPVLMYHSVSKTQKGVYFVTPEQLRGDLGELKARGYENVTLAEVKAYLMGKGDLPEKPVMITFDDGHYNNLYYALDILREEGFTAVLHVIGGFTEYSSTHEKDHVEYSHLTWDEIATLARSGVFEIGSHTYKMHDYKPRFGIKRKKSESSDDYEKALTEDLTRLERALLIKSGVIPVSFAYPFGAYDEESERIVRSLGYDAIFTCYERVNRLKRGDADKLSRLWRINRDGTLTTGAFLERHLLT